MSEPTKLTQEVIELLDCDPVLGPTMQDGMPLLFNFKVARLLWKMAQRIDALEAEHEQLRPYTQNTQVGKG